MTTQEFNDWLQEAYQLALEEIDKYGIRRQRPVGVYFEDWRKELNGRIKAERQIHKAKKEAENWRKKYYKTLWKYKQLEDENLPKDYNPYLELNPKIPTKDQVHSERVK